MPRKVRQPNEYIEGPIHVYDFNVTYDIHIIIYPCINCAYED